MDGGNVEFGIVFDRNDEKDGAHGTLNRMAVKLRTKESGNSQRVKASDINGNLLLKLLQTNYNIILIFTPS